MKCLRIDYFHNLWCGLEHCMTFFYMWMNNLKTYQKMFFYSSLTCVATIPCVNSLFFFFLTMCQLSHLLLFWEKRKIVVLLRREKDVSLMPIPNLRYTSSRLLKVRLSSCCLFTFYFLPVTKRRRNNYNRDDIHSHQRLTF